MSHAWITLAGCLLGALVYGLFNSSINKAILPLANVGLPTWVDGWLGMSYTAVGCSMAVALGVAVTVMEIRLPWKKDASVSGCSGNIWACEAWPPALCGILIGILQVRGPCCLPAALIPCLSVYLSTVVILTVGVNHEFNHEVTHGVRG